MNANAEAGFAVRVPIPVGNWLAMARLYAPLTLIAVVCLGASVRVRKRPGDAASIEGNVVSPEPVTPTAAS